MRIWSIGEVLWDVFPDRETFGGAPLNFSANMKRLGHHSVLLSAVGNDRRGDLAIEKMRLLAIETEFIEVIKDLPTGVALVNPGIDGEPTFLIPRPAAFDGFRPNPAMFSRAAVTEVDWFYLGTLLQTTPSIEQFTRELLAAIPSTRVFYDMNLRDGHWNLALVQRLSTLASILKLNEFEAQTLFTLTQEPGMDFDLEHFCRRWAELHQIELICVTLGAHGCFIYQNGIGLSMPGFAVEVEDTVGSGDAFAAAFLHGYHMGWPVDASSQFANALGALVASRVGATPDWTLDEVHAIICNG